MVNITAVSELVSGPYFLPLLDSLTSTVGLSESSIMVLLLNKLIIEARLPSGGGELDIVDQTLARRGPPEFTLSEYLQDSEFLVSLRLVGGKVVNYMVSEGLPYPQLANSKDSGG
jgi:hypothetical protein